jgi:hypothetical protein
MSVLHGIQEPKEIPLRSGTSEKSNKVDTSIFTTHGHNFREPDDRRSGLKSLIK